jgi:hypothetical protein
VGWGGHGRLAASRCLPLLGCCTGVLSSAAVWWSFGRSTVPVGCCGSVVCIATLLGGIAFEVPEPRHARGLPFIFLGAACGCRHYLWTSCVIRLAVESFAVPVCASFPSILEFVLQGGRVFGGCFAALLVASPADALRLVCLLWVDALPLRLLHLVGYSVLFSGHRLTLCGCCGWGSFSPLFVLLFVVYFGLW